MIDPEHELPRRWAAVGAHNHTSPGGDVLGAQVDSSRRDCGAAPHRSGHGIPREAALVSMRRRWLVDPASIFFGSLAVLTLALVAVLVTATVSVGRINSSSKHAFVEQALPVTAQVRGLLLALVNEETSVRGYIVTGDLANLAPYRAGRHQAVADLAALDRFALDPQEIQPLLRQARSEIAAI